MVENIVVDKKQHKAEKYRQLIPQIKALVDGEEDLIANLANTAAVLKETFNFWWVGFYLIKNKELVLGPFQGPLACTRIQLGKGVCGVAAQEKKTIVVPDVDQFPGHIACSAASRSEIVIPIFNSNDQVVGVLDVDSEKLNHFDERDQEALEELMHYFSTFNWNE